MSRAASSSDSTPKSSAAGDAPDLGGANTPVFTPRRTEKVSEVIAREIVRDIRDLEAGAKLPPEAKLLEQYGVGRASLREALRVLEVQGLIVIRPGPGGGPRVAPIDSSHFGRMASLHFHMAGATYRDTLDARMILEPVVAGMIAQQQDAQHIRSLNEFLQLSAEVPQAAGADPSSGPVYEETVALEFHAMLMGMSGNPVITLLARSLQELRRADGTPALTRPIEDHRHVREIHTMIARAIIEGHPARAEQLMREHMQEFAEYVVLRHPAMLEETVSWH